MSLTLPLIALGGAAGSILRYLMVSAIGAPWGTAAVNVVVVSGLGGNDTIRDDTSKPSIIYGGVGNDWVYSGRGNDVVYGGHGDDALFGGPGDDRMLGGFGDDVLTDNGGVNVLRQACSVPVPRAEPWDCAPGHGIPEMTSMGGWGNPQYGLSDVIRTRRSDRCARGVRHS